MLRLRLWPVVALAASLSAILSASARADQAPWFDAAWTVRRVVDAAAKPAGQAGDEVAVATFYTGGMARPGAADVRVAVQGRRLVKHRVLQAGPGDLVRVAFEVLPSLDRYYVYYGNPKAAADEALEIKRGVLLEVRSWQGGPQPDKLDQVQEAWRKARPVAADVVPNISFGHNPLADSNRTAMLHFVGWFVPTAPGTYSFATNSHGGSWLAIDGQLVVDWPGTHGPTRQAHRTKDVDLKPGLHRIDYWNISHGGATVAVAAVKRPDDKRYVPLPAEVFLPVVRAKLVEVDLRGETLVADFFPEHAGETWWPDQYAVRLHFRNLSRGVSERYGGAFQWDFGDGQTSAEAEPTHVYLLPGNYKVALQAGRGSASNTFQTTVHVDRDWSRQTAEKIDPAVQYAREVARYDLAKLGEANLALAVSLFEHEGLREPLIAAATEMAFARKGLDDKEVLRVGLLLGETLRAEKKYDEAVRAYERLEKRLGRCDRQAIAAIQIGETLLGDRYQYDAAERAYQRVLKEYGDAGVAWELRRVHIGLGDIWRHRGNGDKAREAYQQADAVKMDAQPPNVAAVRVGTLARYVEEYTRERDWEWAGKFLDDWAWEFPLAKLDGHWSLLRANMLVAMGRTDDALREVLDLVAANPHSPYAVRLLIVSAECYVTKGDREKARLMLQTAVEDYPEDAHRDEARRRLQALGGPVKTDAKAVG